MYHNAILDGKRRATVLLAAAITLALGASSAGAQADPIQCRQAIAAAAAKYELARAGALKKCEDAVRKGKLPASTNCPADDPRASIKIAGAQAKLAGVVAKACCGSDKACGTGAGPAADLVLSAYGWEGRVAACHGGERDGLACQTHGDCPSACADGVREGLGCGNSAQCPSGCRGACVGGSFPGTECIDDTSCIGGTCGSKACLGGTNDGMVCVNDAGCPGANTCVASNGCGASGSVVSDCPNLENQGCNGSLSSPADVAACIGCAANVATDQLNDFLYGFLAPVSTSVAGAEKCKAAITGATSKYFAARRKALAKCQKKAISDGLPPGSCPDAGTVAKLGTAAVKMKASIAGKCGGTDKSFGGGDDLALEAIGAPLSCAGVTVPGGSSCSGFLSTMENLADCLACIAEYKSTCNDYIAAPSNGPLPSGCNQLCGNGKIEAGESCDDGNVVDGDACPASCHIASCSVTGSATASVSFSLPAGANVAGLTVYLEYPEDSVQVPGQGNQVQVQNAIGNTPANTVFTPNDLNYALRVVLTENDNAAIAAGTLFEISLNRCNGNPLPAAGAFKCRVESASSPASTNVSGVTCSVVSIL